MILLLLGGALAADVPVVGSLPPTDGVPAAVPGLAWQTGPISTTDLSGRRFELRWTDEGQSELAFVELCADGSASWDFGARTSLTMGGRRPPSFGRWMLTLSSLELRDRETTRTLSVSRDAAGRPVLDGEPWFLVDTRGCPDDDAPPDAALPR